MARYINTLSCILYGKSFKIIGSCLKKGPNVQGLCEIELWVVWDYRSHDLDVLNQREESGLGGILR